jgi:hypothetical protein
MEGEFRWWVRRFTVPRRQAVGVIQKSGVCVGDIEITCKLEREHFRCTGSRERGLFPVSAGASAGNDGLVACGSLLLAAFWLVTFTVIVVVKLSLILQHSLFCAAAGMGCAAFR